MDPTRVNVNGFNFPAYYQYTPGPGQYPGYGTPPPPQPPAKPTPEVVPDAEPAPLNSEPAETRKRGRPKGSGTKSKEVVPDPKTSDGRKPRGRPRGSGSKKTSSPRRKRVKTTHADTFAEQEKENLHVNITPQTIDVTSDSEDETTSKRWPVADRDKFFRFLLDLNEEGDKRFEQHKTNPGHVYKVTFEWMVAFDAFTGNGGGDPDSDDPTAVLKVKLTAARAAGLAIGSLTPATIIEWDKNGWRTLFDDRLGNSAKVTRPVVRSSVAPLSDVEDFADDSDIDPELKDTTNSMTPTPKTPAATVSEPKYVTPASKFRAQAAQSLGNIGEYLKAKMAADEKKTHAFEAKLELDEKRFELDRQKAKVEMARTVCAMDVVSADVKDAANSFLRDYFMS
ncbi:hypothetical protein B0H11DRAFT_2213683 [Mycena galericulata]|nr:hypothetical protein B0H11DRAFT_2213683 [Mycena galericulata]